MLTSDFFQRVKPFLPGTSAPSAIARYMMPREKDRVGPFLSWEMNGILVGGEFDLVRVHDDDLCACLRPSPDHHLDLLEGLAFLRRVAPITTTRPRT